MADNTQGSPGHTARAENGKVEMIAHVVHEANRALCLEQNDQSQPSWEYAEQWQKDSAYEGIKKIQSGEIRTPKESHDSWCRHKIDAGWQYGAKKDAAALTHPCLVPYEMLPENQKVKDGLFFAIVEALS